MKKSSSELNGPNKRPKADAKGVSMSTKKDNLIVGLDIGTTKICCIVGNMTDVITSYSIHYTKLYEFKNFEERGLVFSRLVRQLPEEGDMA